MKKIEQAELEKKRVRVNVSYTLQDYETLTNIAAAQNISIPELIRRYTTQGINGTITQQNIDFLTPIIRRQLESVIDLRFERLATMTAKTCIQAGTAAYLSAEALNSFVPVQSQRSFIDAYDAARKKSLQYLKDSGNLNVFGTGVENKNN